MSGIELRGTPDFLVGSTLDTGTAGGLMEIELERLEKKLDLGVRFVVTRPVFDIHLFRQFIKRVDTTRVAVLPTVLLLKSAGMARYMDRNMKGISIPPDLIRSIQKAPDKPRECIHIAADTIKHLRDMGMPGVLISTVGWEDRLPRILDLL
jgi:5,10-methylenetetrahydrofolate reductase